MNVGINGIFWGQERTGSGQYTRNLWEWLHRLDKTALEFGDDHFRLLGYDSPALSFQEVPSSQTLITSLPQLVGRSGKNGQKVWWEQAGLPGLVKAAASANNAGFDVIHYPYFAAPIRRWPGSTRLVVTVHDLIPLALPEYAPSLALKLYFRLVTAAVQRADLILADSEFSRRDILRLLKVPANKVEVVYLGIDHTRYQPEPLEGEARQALLQKFGLAGDERLIFYIGGFDRRKNVPQLLEAFETALPRLRELERNDGGGRWTLVLAGKPHTTNSLMYPDLSQASATINSNEAGRVHFLGPVSEEDKTHLYRAAQMFVFPSRYEGFGLDPLEALSCGVPTICSRASSLPEVVGEAAQLVAPDDMAGWREAIIKLAAQPGLRGELAHKGPQQAAGFTWRKTAERTLELYNMLECFISRGKAK